MVLRKKTTILAIFLGYMLIPFVLFFILGLTLRGLVFEELLSKNSQLTFIQLLDTVSLYVFIFLIWDIILFFSLTLLFSVIFAKILKIEIEKVAIITLISLVSAYFIFHIIMYLYFLYGDPFGIKENGYPYYLQQILNYYTINSFNITSTDFLKTVFDLLIGYVYDTMFLKDPSLINYLIMYVMMKSFVSNVPFEISGGTGINIYHYEIFIILILYIVIMIPLFLRFVKGCECITEEEIQLARGSRKKRYFGEQEEERSSILGEFNIKNDGD